LLNAEWSKPSLDISNLIAICSSSHSLLATAVARVLWHEAERLEGAPYGFGVRVKGNLDKSYDLCDECCNEDGDPHDYCSHFWDQLSDYDPRRYHETTNGTAG